MNTVFYTSILNYLKKSHFSQLIFLYLLSTKRTGMPQPTCGTRRTTQYNQLSPSTFKWVPGIKLRLPSLCGMCLYPLRNLASPQLVNVKLQALVIHLLIQRTLMHGPKCSQTQILNRGSSLFTQEVFSCHENYRKYHSSNFAKKVYYKSNFSPVFLRVILYLCP